MRTKNRLLEGSQNDQTRKQTAILWVKKGPNPQVQCHFWGPKPARDPKSSGTKPALTLGEVGVVGRSVQKRHFFELLSPGIYNIDAKHDLRSKRMTKYPQ